MAQSEYLQREQAAKKQLGSKGVRKRVRQLPTAARATLKEMTGVDISRRGVSIDPVQLGMSVLGYTRLGSVAAKAASRALKAGDVASAKLAQAAADQFKLASKFPKSAGARTVDKKIIGEIIKQRVKTQNPGPLRVPGAMRLGMETAGDDLYWTSKYVRTGEIEAAHRGIAKIVGKAGRVDPVLRDVGRDIRAVSGYRKYKGIVPKKAK